jgi:hypothetical protein
MTPEGKEITEYDTPGELVVRGPSVVLGYLNNEKATEETFEDGWMRTGDEAVVRVGPKGTEHVFIVDRIKELIKVKVSHTIHNVRRTMWTKLINFMFRVSRLPQLNLKPTSSPILMFPIAPLLPSRMTEQEKFPRRLLSRHLQQVRTNPFPRSLSSTSKTTRPVTNG